MGPALAESAEELLLGMGRCDPAGKLGSRGRGRHLSAQHLGSVTQILYEEAVTPAGGRPVSSDCPHRNRVVHTERCANLISCASLFS